MRQIELTQGKVAVVDAADYDSLVASGPWHYANGYAARNERQPNGKYRLVGMHRVILDAPDGMHVDHIDGDRSNNTRDNLRLCTNTENLRNQRVNSNSRSRIKGVSWNRRKSKWRAEIQVDGKQIHLGYFQNPIDASQAYDRAAKKYFGEFALLNDLNPYSWSLDHFMQLVAATCRKS